ncbi:MAG: hypothetical protein C4B59_14470 [Candidatus Methanogaster sp.]|uniref:Uncharacterized protein n=1 Tax=Candidatus Methanogaster sp. TaxID=3386292 RepID=A0AC61KZS8_9EURY|nr:MAG: hypothetical protein C4B59_14470 [ANME-2 cluster archaeon]
MMLDVTPHGVGNGTDCSPLYQGVAMLCFTLHLAASGAHDDAADVSRDGRVTSLNSLMILQTAAET